MSRWIVFDNATADAVQSRWGVRPEIHAEERGEILQMVLKSRAAVAVGPASEPGKVLLIRMSRPQPPTTSMPRKPASNLAQPTPAKPMSNLTPPAPAKPASNLAPAGFLGLSDSIDMDSNDEPERPKKWWQKILG
jgi:hypothetical protein